MRYGFQRFNNKYEFEKTKFDKENPYLDQIIKISSDAFSIPRDEFYKQLDKNLDLVFLLMIENNEVLGVAKLVEEGQGKVVVSNVAIKRRLQGKGLGSILMNKIMSDYETVTLNAVQRGALKFYLKLGMTVIDFKTRKELGKETDNSVYKIEGKWVLSWSKKNMKNKTIFYLRNDKYNSYFIQEYVSYLVDMNPIVLCENYVEDVNFYNKELGLRCEKLPENENIVTKHLAKCDYLCIITENEDTELFNFLIGIKNANIVTR